MIHDVVIVGAGLAGLCCARRIAKSNHRFLLLEASDGVGGRIRTDRVDGFLLDRGFQVFLAAYPEAKQILDYRALDLHAFQPGAVVRFGGAFHRLADPWRRPLAALRSLFSPIGTLLDKAKVARLRSRSLQGTIDDRFNDPETTTLEALKQAGFSSSMIERFFRPFLGGIFLESDLLTSSRMFQFVFRMFSIGDTCLPAPGMEAIPRQLASGLSDGTIRFNARVVRIEPGAVQLETGETIHARAIVAAVEGPTAAKLLGGSLPEAAHGVTCLYFAADLPPVQEPVIVLNGEGCGPVNNLCVPNMVTPSYSPLGQHLVSATVLGMSPLNDAALETQVREQLTGWFGSPVGRWRHLRTYRIPYALPQQNPPVLATPQRPVRWTPGVYVCGDHRDNASIQGAMVSGRRAAEAVLADLA